MAQRLREELSMYTDGQVVVHPVRQMQELAHYTVRFNLRLDRAAHHRTLTEALRAASGVWVASPGIRSTHEVEYCLREPSGDTEVPSVVVLEELLVPGPSEGPSDEVEIHVALAPQHVTARANLDSIRFLVTSVR